MTAHRETVERYVRFRVSAAADADDILQETWLTACRRFGQLKNQESFKAWALSIARSKCADHFRRTAGRREISLDALPEWDLPDGGADAAERLAVRDVLELLDRRDREILYLRFWEELPQIEIARRLGIPLGTVKSRLHAAKERFKSRYPCPASSKKGELSMKKMPEYLPDYTMTRNQPISSSHLTEKGASLFLVIV